MVWQGIVMFKAVTLGVMGTINGTSHITFSSPTRSTQYTIQYTIRTIQQMFKEHITYIKCTVL